MAKIRHMAMCTKNNRRLARFYRSVFGLEELWSDKQNSPYSFYTSDGYINLNILQIRAGMSYEREVDGHRILPEVEINHLGYQVDNTQEIKKRLAELDPPGKMIPSPQDGRWEEYRLIDPDGNVFETAERGWGAEEGRRLPAIGHVAIKTGNPGRLADFYKFVLDLKEVRRMDVPETSTEAIFLSDGTISLELVKNPPLEKPGYQLVGFHVEGIKETERRIKAAPSFLYPGEPKVEIMHRPPGGPYKTAYLRDPDGNFVDLSEEGWVV